MKRIGDWLLERPYRFFGLALSVFGVLIISIDWIGYRWKLPDVLVEAHGLLYDLLVFGIILEAYQFFKDKRDEKERTEAEKKHRIERYMEELDDYRGWYEEEAGYRVAGIIRRLENIGEKKMNFQELNLSICSSATIMFAAKQGRISYLRKARLNGANLQGANLYKANLEETHLRGADLRGANLEGANLKGAVMCDMGNLMRATLNHANLEEAKLDDSIFIEASLNHSNLRNAVLAYSDFTKATINFSNLTGANLEGGNFQDASLFVSKLNRAHLVRANFEKANLGGANLYEANLRNAILKGANLRGATLNGADIWGADFAGVILRKEDWEKWLSAQDYIIAKYYLSGPDKNGVCSILEKSAKDSLPNETAAG